MTNDEHEAMRERLSDYALGCLDVEEAAELERHLRACADCREELAAFEAVSDALALAAADAEPSPALRGRLLAVAGGGVVAPVVPVTSVRRANPRPPGVARRPRGAARPLNPRRAWPALAVLALAAVVLGWLLWAAAGRLLDGPVVALAPTGFAPGARGELRLNRAGDAAVLVVEGLPALPPDRQYQLWLVRGDERDTGAIFSVDATGWAETPVTLPRAAADYDRFGITIEPAGGSPGPTGEGVLRSGGGVVD